MILYADMARKRSFSSSWRRGLSSGGAPAGIKERPRQCVKGGGGKKGFLLSGERIIKEDTLFFTGRKSYYLREGEDFEARGVECGGAALLNVEKDRESPFSNKRSALNSKRSRGFTGVVLSLWGVRKGLWKKDW